MNTRVAWTLVAVILVAMFFAARIYVAQMIDPEAEVVSRIDRMPAISPAGAPKPPSPRAEPKPDPLAELADLAGRVMAIQEAALEEREPVIADAHAALAQVDTLSVEWTPELATRANRLLALADRAVARTPDAPADLIAHVLAVRVAVADNSGSPNAELTTRLAELKKSQPEAFDW